MLAHCSVPAWPRACGVPSHQHKQPACSTHAHVARPCAAGRPVQTAHARQEEHGQAACAAHARVARPCVAGRSMLTAHAGGRRQRVNGLAMHVCAAAAEAAVGVGEQSGIADAVGDASPLCMEASEQQFDFFSAWYPVAFTQ
eukprot:357755-Chlamydomonas_euryale.AAC.4